MAATLSITAAGAWGQAVRPEPATLGTQDRIIPLEATVNGQKAGGWPFLERAGVLYVTRDALEEWRLHVRGDLAPIIARGGEYWPLSAIPGFSAKINYANLSIDLSFSPDAFSGTQLKLAKDLERPKLSPVLPTAFLNYDLNFVRSSQGGVSSHDLGAVVELGASSRLGVITTTHMGRNLTGEGSERREWIRLETTYTRDMPESNLTLRVGDSATRQGLWGRSVYFGGVQLGRNYALSPGLLTQPLPLFTGVSAAPSTVELYINDQLRKVSQVPTGPFVIDTNNLGFTSSGEARIVVRDILGREVVIVQPFFSAVQLLAPGLDDWSAEIGTVRRNLGVESWSYGQGFATGTWRRGLTDRVTLEGRAEWSSSLTAFGIGGHTALPADWMVRAAFARSRHEQAGTGTFWTLGIDKQWVTTQFSLQAQGATAGFRELGMAATALPTQLQWAARWSQVLDTGLFGVAIARIHRFDAEPVTTVSASYSHRLGATTALAANASRVFGPGGGTSVGLSMQIQLEPYRTVSSSFSSHGGSQDLYATVTQSATPQSRLGWRLLAGRLQREGHVEASADYNGPQGRLYADLGLSPSQNSLRLGASGAVALADGHAFFTQRLDESFAVAELKGFGNVGIGLGSTPSTRTDASGIALVRYLAPYQHNQIRLDPRDVPLSADLESIEVSVVPAWRSAVKVDFPVRSGRGAVLRLELENGDPVPAGAVVRIVGDTEDFYVGRRGEAFVTGLQPNNKLDVRYRGGQCSLDLKLPAANDDILRLGPLTCRR